jgi:hypothetical protein
MMVLKSERTRPCPRCGSMPIIGKYKNPTMTSSLFYIECSGCRWGHNTLFAYPIKSKIIAVWNDCVERCDEHPRDLVGGGD